jgi:hypothetical protein
MASSADTASTLRGSNSSSGHSSASATPSGTNETAARFLLQAKAELDLARYKRFQQLLRDYKSKKIDVQTLMHDVLQLLSLPAETHLASGFVRFIPSRKQPMFLQFLERELAQRLLNQGGDAHSRTPVSVDNHVGGQLASSNPILPPPSPVDSPSPSVAAPPPDTAPDNRDDDVILVKEEDILALVDDTDINPVTAGAPRPQKRQCTRSDEVRPPADQHPSGPVDFVVAFECPICTRDTKNPFAARCGHACCYDCWSKWLPDRWACPVCRSRVRMSQLVQLQFH